MTGRGIDQALPHPGDPTLYETYVRDARDYLALAQMAHGHIGEPLDFEWIWGEALTELNRPQVDFRLINLETSVTRSDKPWSGKGIHYRMHPQNIDCIKAAKIDCCSLANNHTLDWGPEGLLETFETLEKNEIAYAGAGRTLVDAKQPAVISRNENRFIVVSAGSTDSGIPSTWTATTKHCGLNVIDEFSEETADQICRTLMVMKGTGDIAIASIHWGNNWGYDIPYDHINFAHRLVEGGFDIIHGHSSHHALPFEVYHDRLILYGCGDFINDYEGITGYESFRGDLAPMYLIEVEPGGALCAIRIVLFAINRFQLKRVAKEDVQWFRKRLEEVGGLFNLKLEIASDNSLEVQLR